MKRRQRQLHEIIGAIHTMPDPELAKAVLWEASRNGESTLTIANGLGIEPSLVTAIAGSLKELDLATLRQEYDLPPVVAVRRQVKKRYIDSRTIYGPEGHKMRIDHESALHAIAALQEGFDHSYTHEFVLTEELIQEGHDLCTRAIERVENEFLGKVTKDLGITAPVERWPSPDILSMPRTVTVKVEGVSLHEAQRRLNTERIGTVQAQMPGAGRHSYEYIVSMRLKEDCYEVEFTNPLYARYGRFRRHDTRQAAAALYDRALEAFQQASAEDE